jgi:hypothetical protein
MKKIILVVMAICLSFTLIPLQSSAATSSAPTSTPLTKPEEAAEAKVLTLRLTEISTMDMSKLNSSDKKNLRHEVRSIKRELKDISGGVYISAGALIVILILAIILL